jgi:peptidoglycan/LPS O-acetylase OafA/YrhL
MSDIAIRFDGLALLATLALSALAYLLIALVTLILRRRQTCRRAFLMGLATLALTAAFFAWWKNQGTGASGPDLIDALILPWAALFLAGCWHLAGTRRS